MATLQKYHDVTTFCSDKPLPSGAPQDHVKYDARTKTLVACDGKIGLVVPVPGECTAPDGLITQAKIKTAAEKQQELAALDGKLAVNRKEVTPHGDAEVGKFGNVFGVMHGHEPDLLIPLSLETLGPLVEYTRQHAAGGIYLCVDHTPGGNWQERKIDGAIQFLLDVTAGDKATGSEAVQAVGVLMPCAVENMTAIHSRVRAAVALVNAGKSEKEKAAAARKRAAQRKAAKAAVAPQPAAGGKKQGRAAATDVDEPETESADTESPTCDDAEDEAVVLSLQRHVAKASRPTAARPSRDGSRLELADLLTRAQASLSRQKFAAARRLLNTARAEIAAGHAGSELIQQIDALDVRISKDKAAHKKGS